MINLWVATSPPLPLHAREERRGGERVACVASVSARVRREKLGLETLATQAREREKWGTTKPKLLTLYVALTMHNSLPAPSHVGWFSRSFYCPWGKMGTTRSLHTCLTYLLWQPFVVSSRNAPDRCVSGALGDDTTQLRRRLSGVCLDSTNCEVVLKKESPLFKPCFSFE